MNENFRSFAPSPPFFLLRLSLLSQSPHGRIFQGDMKENNVDRKENT